MTGRESIRKRKTVWIHHLCLMARKPAVQGKSESVDTRFEGNSLHAMIWPWSKKTIANVAVKLPLSELRKRARILVVDDDPSAFPHKLLAKEGYNVTYWR